MSKNHWLNYNNELKLGKRPVLQEICYEKEVLVLKLLSRDNDGRKIQIIFDNILSLRDTNESFALKTIASLYEQDRKDKDFDSNAWIFVSENTHFIDWLHDESDSLYKNHRIKHFMIVSAESVTDVLSFDEPLIKCQC